MIAIRIWNTSRLDSYRLKDVDGRDKPGHDE